MRHLLRFYSGEGKPTIIYREEDEEGKGEVKGLELSGRQDIAFSDKFSCIGFKTPDGYCSCKNSAVHTRQCPTCAALDISRAYTVGNFSGLPQLYEEAKKQEYVLYLAGFGEEIVKCGVTRKERFENRMREQGADFGCIIAKYSGPDEIYNAEASIQSRFSFSNSVRLAQKMRLLEFDVGEARENFSSKVQMVVSSELLPSISPQIIDFSQFYPHAKRAEEAKSIHGEIIGAKGEILLFKSDSNRHSAVNMRKHVGAFF